MPMPESASSPQRRPALEPGRAGALAASLGAALALAACAGLPAPHQRPSIRPVEQYASARSLDAPADTPPADAAPADAAPVDAAPAGTWPADDWWTRYRDPQLDTLMTEALAGSPSLAEAQARLARAQAAAQVSEAATGPQLGANASVTQQKQSYNHLSPRAVTPQGWNDYGRATLDFSWELDFWGRHRAALAAATSEAEAARADAAQARLVLASALAAAYAEFAREHAALDTARAARDVRARTAELFRRRHENGLETLASVRQVDARRASADGEVLAIEEQIALQRHRLAALAGAGPDRGLALARPTVDLGVPDALPPRLSAQLLGRRPDIVAARLRAEAAAERIAQARAAFYPDVNLFAFAGVQSLGLDMLTKSGSSIGSIGPALSLPIFDGGRLRGQLRGAEAEYALAVAAYDRTLVQALQEVADALASRRALGPRLERGGEAVDAAREAWSLQARRYTGGLATYLEVLSAEDVLLANQRAQTDLQSSAFTLQVALVRALGGGYSNL